MLRGVSVLIALFCVTQGCAFSGHLFKDHRENPVSAEKRIAALRKLPVTISLGSDYIVSRDLPLRSGLQRFTFELYQGASALTELTTNVVLHALANVGLIAWIGPTVVLHEVSGHGHANSVFFGKKSLFRSEPPTRDGEQKDKARAFLGYLPRGLFSLGGATKRVGNDDLGVVWPEAWDIYDELDDAIVDRDKALRTQCLQRLVSTKHNFDFFQRKVRVSYAGVNAETEMARYVSHRILQGEVVRPEAVVSYIMTGVLTYPYNPKHGANSDLNTMEAYYDAIGCAKGFARRVRMMSAVSLLCSGTLWSFLRASWRLERVRPFWLFDRILMPNFYVFYTTKGTSLMVESAVRVNDQWTIDFGSEWVVDKGRDPFTKERYTGVDVRLGAVWRCCEGLTVAAYSLVNHFGGAAEMTYAHPDRHFGMSLGASWASDKSLGGERMVNYAFDSKGRELSGYVRLSYII